MRSSKLNNKRTLLCLLSVVFVAQINTAGCQNIVATSYPTEMLIGKERLVTYHCKRLTDKETPYTMCFENNDGTASLYIFASPIAFYDTSGTLQAIDKTLVPVSGSAIKKMGYSLELRSCDIQSYFPTSLEKVPFLIQGIGKSLTFTPSQELIERELRRSTFVDLVGREHQSVVYQQTGNILIEYAPTASGILANVILLEKPEYNQVAFYIDKLPETDFVVVDNQYILLKATSDSSAQAIIRTSFLQDSSGKISFDNIISMEPAGGQWKYVITLDEGFLNNPDTTYPLIISPTFELPRNNTPDSTVYSNKPEINAHLAGYGVLSNGAYIGIGLHYLQLRINYIFKSYEQNVKNAEYVIPVLSLDSDATLVDMFRLGDFWNSTTITWNSKPATYGKENAALINGAGWYKFDITSFVKLCIKDDRWNTETYGLAIAMANDSSGNKVIATNDNSLYQPFVMIDFYDLPWTLERIDEINPGLGY